jgi:hypothetical protein
VEELILAGADIIKVGIGPGGSGTLVLCLLLHLLLCYPVCYSDTPSVTLLLHLLLCYSICYSVTLSVTLVLHLLLCYPVCYSVC